MSLIKIIDPRDLLSRNSFLIPRLRSKPSPQESRHSHSLYRLSVLSDPLFVSLNNKVTGDKVVFGTSLCRLTDESYRWVSIYPP